MPAHFIIAQKQKNGNAVGITVPFGGDEGIVRGGPGRGSGVPPARHSLPASRGKTAAPGGLPPFESPELWQKGRPAKGWSSFLVEMRGFEAFGLFSDMPAQLPYPLMYKQRIPHILPHLPQPRRPTVHSILRHSALEDRQRGLLPGLQRQPVDDGKQLVALCVCIFLSVAVLVVALDPVG